jgi:serine/threonine-protein kinase
MATEVLGDPQVATGVREGDVLAGKYRIEKILGAGGMGVVVAARHIELYRKVAIKFLIPRPPSRSRASTSSGSIEEYALASLGADLVRCRRYTFCGELGRSTNGATTTSTVPIAVSTLSTTVDLGRHAS